MGELAASRIPAPFPFAPKTEKSISTRSNMLPCATATIGLTENKEMKTYSVEQVLRAQKALRDAASLGPEMFPIEALVGMISDEIENLRARGKTDSEIAALITENSSIEITGEEISENYSSPEDRHHAD